MRNMSFALTTTQVLTRTKTVTRRIGWRFLKAGDLLQPVKRCQGLKKNERVEKIGGPIRVVNVRRERLSDIGADDVVREGFPEWTSSAFVEMFANVNGCRWSRHVTRIEFEYVDA